MPDPTFLKRLLDGLLLPPGGALLLLAAGLLLRRARPRAAGLLVGCGALILWMLSTPAVASLLLRALETGQAPLHERELRALMRDTSDAPQAIVILGSGLRRGAREDETGEVPTQRALERLAAGARAHRVTGLPILVSGGRLAPLRHAEGPRMAATLERDFGLRTRWVEDASLDTAANARESARLLGADGLSRVLLVTHAAHMPRAAAVFRAAGLRVTPMPTAFLAGPVDDWRAWLPSPSAMDRSWLALHEIVGLRWYRLRGHARSGTADVSTIPVPAAPSSTDPDPARSPS